MNLETKLYLAASAAGTLLGVGYFIAVHRHEARKRAQIETDTTAELRAIAKAKDIMLGRINAGMYPSGSMDLVLNDLKFYTIVNRDIKD